MINFAVKDLTLSELKALKNQIEQEITNRTTSTPRQLKRLKQFSKIQASVYRKFRKVMSSQLAKSKTRQYLAAYNLPLTKTEVKNINLTFIKKQAKKLMSASNYLTKKMKATEKKAKEAAKKQLSSYEYDEFIKEWNEKKKLLTTNYQENIQKEQTSLTEMKGSLENQYGRLFKVIRNNTYPDKTEYFKNILKDQGYDIDNDKISKKKIFNKSLKQTFGTSKYKKVFGKLADEISAIAELFEI